MFDKSTLSMLNLAAKPSNIPGWYLRQNMKKDNSNRLSRSRLQLFYSQRKQRVQFLIIALLNATVVYGCAQIRKVTYPRDFVYLEQKEIDSEMLRLSLYIHELNAILAGKDYISSEDQSRIVEVLSLINTTTDALGAGSVDTSHLVIDDHIDQFKSDVIAAISAAKAKPPNYFIAGELAGSCVACHQFRKF